MIIKIIMLIFAAMAAYNIVVFPTEPSLFSAFRIGMQVLCVYLLYRSLEERK